MPLSDFGLGLEPDGPGYYVDRRPESLSSVLGGSASLPIEIRKSPAGVGDPRSLSVALRTGEVEIIVVVVLAVGNADSG